MTDYPKDPMMLLSWVNMKLRDFYPSLEDLCSDMEIDLEGLVKKLSEAGFVFNRDLNKFW